MTNMNRTSACMLSTTHSASASPRLLGTCTATEEDKKKKEQEKNKKEEEEEEREDLDHAHLEPLYLI